MSVPVLLKVAAEVGGVDLAIRGAKSIWSRMPWAQDAQKREAVDGAAERFLRDAEELVTHVPEEEAEKSLRRLADGFQKHVAELGLSSEDAAQVRATLLEQIDLRAIRPIKRLRALEARLADLEKAEERRVGSEPLIHDRLEQAAKRAERAYLGLGLAIGLAVAAFGIALVALTK